MEIITRRTGQTVLPNTSQGPNFTMDADWNMAVTSETLPSADMIFFPVMVTSREVSSDTIEELLKSSRPAVDRLLKSSIENGEDSQDQQLEPRFILPPDRDPKFLLEPTSLDLPDYRDLKLPFLGWTREQVFAAWIGSDHTSTGDDVAPLRWTDNVPDKPRYWTKRSYLVLDEDAGRPNQEPLALLAYLDVNSSNVDNLQYIRCDFPVSLRLMILLDSGIRDINYVRTNLLDGEGVVRNKKYEDWFKLGGMADQEVESG